MFAKLYDNKLLHKHHSLCRGKLGRSDCVEIDTGGQLAHVDLDGVATGGKAPAGEHTNLLAEEIIECQLDFVFFRHIEHNRRPGIEGVGKILVQHIV